MIRLSYGPVQMQCDTPEEAAALVLALKLQDAPPAPTPMRKVCTEQDHFSVRNGRACPDCETIVWRVKGREVVAGNRPAGPSDPEPLPAALEGALPQAEPSLGVPESERQSSTDSLESKQTR